MKPEELIPALNPIPEEKSLVRRARSGEADAFIQLFDAYGDDLFRYVYFRALSDVAAEAITSQVFRHAWNHLESYPRRAGSFAAWLYEIARNQVIIYYTANLRGPAFSIGTLVGAADYRLDDATPEWSHMPAWVDHLRLLTGDIEQSRLQTMAALIMRRYLEYLNPGKVGKSSPTFNAYTRAWLLRYLQLHPRRPRIFAVSRLSSAARAALAQARAAVQVRPFPPVPVRRVALAAAAMAAVLLVTSTASAQVALPGDALYGWKRSTEEALLTVSPDRVGVELFLADRRLDEWIQVEKDPQRSATASNGYYQALRELSARDAQSLARIAPVLESHRKKLSHSGLASPQQLDQILAVAASVAPTPGDSGLATALTPPTSTQPAAAALLTATHASTAVQPGIAATSTTVPTQVPPTATPTATPVPTEIPPTATPTTVPTEIPPTATATAVPTEIPPTATPVPTEIVPTPTDAPIEASTDVPTAELTEVPPTSTPLPAGLNSGDQSFALTPEP